MAAGLVVILAVGLESSNIVFNFLAQKEKVSKGFLKHSLYSISVSPPPCTVFIAADKQ
jgi:hypothetical protein